MLSFYFILLVLKFINSPKLNSYVKFDVFWTPSKFLIDDGCLPFYSSYFCASLALFYMFVFQKYMFFLSFTKKVHFLLKFLFVFCDEFMWRWDINRFKYFLCLFNNNSFEIDFLWFHSAFALCGNGFRRITINEILSAYGVKNTKWLRNFLNTFLCWYYRLKMPIKKINKYLLVDIRQRRKVL